MKWEVPMKLVEAVKMLHLDLLPGEHLLAAISTSLLLPRLCFSWSAPSWWPNTNASSLLRDVGLLPWVTLAGGLFTGLPEFLLTVAWDVSSLSFPGLDQHGGLKRLLSSLALALFPSQVIFPSGPSNLSLVSVYGRSYMYRKHFPCLTEYPNYLMKHTHGIVWAKSWVSCFFS